MAQTKDEELLDEVVDNEEEVHEDELVEEEVVDAEELVEDDITDEPEDDEEVIEDVTPEDEPEEEVVEEVVDDSNEEPTEDNGDLVTIKLLSTRASLRKIFKWISEDELLEVDNFSKIEIPHNEPFEVEVPKSKVDKMTRYYQSLSSLGLVVVD